MAIQFRAVGAVANVGGTALTIDAPAGVVAGDLLLLQLLTGALNVSEPTIAGDWKIVPQSIVVGTDRTRVYYKVAGVSEPASYLVTSPSSVAMTGAIIAIYSDTAALLNIVDGASQVNPSGNRIWPSVTAQAIGDWLLCFGLLPSFSSTPAAGMTERWDSGAPRAYLMTEVLAASGATGTRTATGTASTSMTASLVVTEGAQTLFAGPQWRGYSFSDASTQTGSKDIAAPTELAVDDLMIMHVSIGTDTTPTPPAGWTAVPNGEIVGTNSIRTYYKIAEAGDLGATFTVTYSGSRTVSLAVVALYSPAGLGLSIVDSQLLDTTVAQATIPFPSVTTTATNALVVMMTSGATVNRGPTAPKSLRRYDGTVPDIGCQTEYFFVAGAMGTRDMAVSSGTHTSRSVSIAVQEGAAPDGAPSGLNAVAVSETQINLTWTDNSTDEDEFKIERSPDGAGSWVEIDTNPADDTTYSDTGLTLSTTYYYRVRASNTGGDTDYSNTASATTEEYAIRTTTLGVTVEFEGEATEDVTTFGALVELGTDTLNATLFALLVEIEEIAAVATYFVQPSPGRQPHLLLPEIVTGYQLDERGSFWTVVLPSVGQNRIHNPSFEHRNQLLALMTITGFDDWEVSHEQASRGFWSLKLVTGGVEGVAYTSFYPDRTGWHVFALDIYHDMTQRFTIEVTDSGGGTVYASAEIEPATTGWARYYLPYYEPGSFLLGRRCYLRSAVANTGLVYTDGWHVGPAEAEQVYFDGDTTVLAFDADPYAFSWEGEAHGSVSTAAQRVHTAGILVSLFDLDFKTTGVVGLGLLDPELDVATFTDGTELSKGTLMAGKDFSIVGRVMAETHRQLAQKRQAVIDHFNFLNASSGLLRLGYQPIDRDGIPYGKRLWANCAFIGGLSGNLNNLYQDNLELRFRLFDGRLYEEFGNVAELAFDGYAGTNTTIFSRDPHTGAWEQYLTDTPTATTGGQVNCVLVMDDGSLIVGGSFTAIGGVTARRCAKWDPTSRTWAEYGGGFNNTVFALALGRGTLNPQVIAGGAFTNNPGSTNPMLHIAYHNGIQFVQLGVGVDDTVHDIDVSPDGWVYIVGAFLADGGAAPVRNFGAFDASIGGDGLWHNFVTSLTGGVEPTMWAVKVNPENTKVFIGGTFSEINDDPLLRCVAQWNTGPGGTGTYSALETGLSAQVVDLEFGPDGYLYAVGDFSQDGAFTRLIKRFARWNGNTWEEVGRGEIDEPMQFMAWDKRGNAYVIMEQNAEFGTESVIFQWTGSTWIPMDFIGENASFAAMGRPHVSPAGRLFLGTAGSTVEAFGGHTEIDYQGTAETSPRFTLIGPATLHRIDNWTLDKHVYFDGLTLLADEQLFVEFSPPRAWTNLRDDVLDFVVVGISDLEDFKLTPGTNHVTVTATGTDGDTKCLLSWHNAHFSIDAAS